MEIINNLLHILKTNKLMIINLKKDKTIQINLKLIKLMKIIINSLQTIKDMEIMLNSLQMIKNMEITIKQIQIKEDNHMDHKVDKIIFKDHNKDMALMKNLIICHMEGIIIMDTMDLMDHILDQIVTDLMEWLRNLDHMVLLMEDRIIKDIIKVLVI